MAATSLTFKLANLRAQLSSFALIIVGIAVSAIFTAVVGLVSTMVSRADARSISFWNFGSLALVTRENLVGISITAIIGAVIAWRISPALDRLSLGDATAFHLGVDVAKLRLVALIALSLLAGGAVSTRAKPSRAQNARPLVFASSTATNRRGARRARATSTI